MKYCTMYYCCQEYDYYGRKIKIKPKSYECSTVRLIFSPASDYRKWFIDDGNEYVCSFYIRDAAKIFNVEDFEKCFEFISFEYGHSMDYDWSLVANTILRTPLPPDLNYIIVIILINY